MHSTEVLCDGIRKNVPFIHGSLLDQHCVRPLSGTTLDMGGPDPELMTLSKIMER